MDISTYNCGPYWSDGKLQSSVPLFNTTPVNRLDRVCQEHDRSYALAGGDKDKLTEADNKFFDALFLATDFPFRGTLYSLLVKYGNYTTRKMGGIVSTYVKGAEQFSKIIAKPSTNVVKSVFRGTILDENPDDIGKPDPHCPVVDGLTNGKYYPEPGQVEQTFEHNVNSTESTNNGFRLNNNPYSLIQHQSFHPLSSQYNTYQRDFKRNRRRRFITCQSC